MNTELVLRNIESRRAELDRLTTEALRKELASALQLTADSLLHTALIVRTLEERGEDLSELKIGLLPYLRQIAYGQVAPEVIVRFAQSPQLIRLISTLPAPDQMRLGAGDPVQIVVRREDGGADHRMIDPLLLTRDQVHLVFTAGRIRPLEEQATILDDRPVRKTSTRTIGKIKVDAKRGVLKIGYTKITPDEARAALAELSVGEMEIDESQDDGAKMLAVKLTEDQHRRLKMHAAERGIPMNVLALRALHAAGLI